jgi:enamine deaminase RidA (YjgF/YER057c/UK114 family)
MKRFLKAPGIFATPGQPHALAHGQVFKRVLIGAQVGADPAGNVPEGLEAQFALAFDNLLAVIGAVQLSGGDLIKITAFVVVPGSRQLYQSIFERKIGGTTPLLTYVEIAWRGDPRWLVSLEGEAIQEVSP